MVVHVLGGDVAHGRRRIRMSTEIIWKRRHRASSHDIIGVELVAGASTNTVRPKPNSARMAAIVILSRFIGSNL